MQYSDDSDENYEDADDDDHQQQHGNYKRKNASAAAASSPLENSIQKKRKQRQSRLTTGGTCRANKDLYIHFETLPEFYITGSGNATKCYQCICLYCKRAYHAALATTAAGTTTATAATAAQDMTNHADLTPPEIVKRSRRECEAHLFRCKHKQQFDAVAAASDSLTAATTCALPPTAAAATTTTGQHLSAKPSSNKKRGGASDYSATTVLTTTPAPPPVHCTLFFSLARKSYFDQKELTLQGCVTPGGAVGGPVSAPTYASRQLVIQGASAPEALPTALSKTTVGSWWFSTGTWSVLEPRNSTMVFYVWTGHALVIDAALDENGHEKQHFFGPGDTVILPKGWSGRWNVQQDIQFVWFDYKHEIDIMQAAHESSCIRAKVTRYQEFAPQLLQAQGAFQQQQQPDAYHTPPPRIALRIIYDKSPILKVGCWTCTPGSFMIQQHATTECFHVLEGVFFLTNTDADGSARRCVAGDTVVIPKGWTGHVDVIQTVKKLWFAVD